VVSHATFERLSQAQGSLVDFMRRSPLYGADDISFTNVLSEHYRFLRSAR
jgi:hypothetical protein